MEYCKYCKKRVLTKQWDIHIKSEPHKKIQKEYYKYYIHNKKNIIFYNILYNMIK
jgi:hypothetical protein